MKSVAKSLNNSVQEIAKTTKGYMGYEEPKKRQKTDRNFREFITSSLISVSERVPNSNGHVQKDFKPSHKKALGQISHSLKTVIESLKKPCYCNQSFFNKPNITSDQLQQLYDYDLDLKGQIGILNEESMQLKNIRDDHEISDALRHIYDIIDGINQILTEREFLIMSIIEFE